VDDLTQPVGIVALAAAGLALACLIALVVVLVRMRRLRAAQRAVLRDGRSQDLVAHAATLQEAFLALQERVEEVAEGLDARTRVAEERLDGTIAHRALVRYDAYGELSGAQSLSLALLDAHGSGVVLSCISNRDTQRLYCRQVLEGEGEHELSPEEREAIRRALAGERTSVTLEP
jgi:hypothetical protein